MRTRNKRSVTKTMVFPAAGYTSVGTLCNGTTANGSGSHALPVVHDLSFEEERMTDALGKKQPHPVWHRKYIRDVTYGGELFGIPTHFGGADYGLTLVNDGGRTQVGSALASATAFDWDVSSNTTTPPYWTDTSPTINEAPLISDLLKQARQLKADVLLNVVESKQIVPSFKSLTSSLPQMAKHWKDIRKVLKTASGSYLAWKFGVSPILSDIMAIHRYLPKIKEGFKRHMDKKHSRFSRKVEMNMELAPSAYASGYYPLNGYNCYKWFWTGEAFNLPESRYVLVVKPSVKHDSGITKAIDFAVSRFASSPAELAWELVPFSFVVDWLVDVSGALRLVDKSLGFEPYTIVSFTRSRSYGLQTTAELQVCSPCNGGAVGTYLSTHKYYSYERSVVSSSVLPTWRPRFGKNQAGISAALITQALTSIRSKRVISAAINVFNKAVHTELVKPIKGIVRTAKKLS